MKKEYCSDLLSKEKMQHSLEFLASEVKGQHTGEMLSLLPSSVFGTNGIFGFIVQGTNVRPVRWIFSVAFKLQST